jgi:putative integral membrane protein (TIGR02587 family)
VLIDSVEELGLGFLVAALVLWLLSQVHAAMRPNAILGAVLLEGLLAAIGVSVGTAQLGGGDDQSSGANDSRSDNNLGGQLALSACGATLIAANVAPTEEIAVIAGSASGWHLLGMAGLALLLATLIIFYSGFVGAGPRPGRPAILREIVGTYAVALLVSAALLWFFSRLHDQDLAVIVARVVVLSVPAALGASAGRLLLQGGGQS